MIQEPRRLLTFQTDDPDYFADNITSVAPSVTVQTRGRAPFSAQIQLIRLPRLGLFKVGLSSASVCVPEPLGYGSLTIPLRGNFEMVTNGQADLFTPGSAYMAHWDDPFDLRIGDRIVALVVNIDTPLLHDYLRKLSGGNAPATRRLGLRLSLARPGGASFWRYLSFVWNEYTRGSAICWSPLVLKEMEDALVAMLLNALDDQPGDTQPGGAQGSAVYLTRAEEYILTHLDAPTSMTDLAEVAGVSARTLSRAFRQRHGLSPMEFLKERRLEAAQRALLAANPGSITVTDIAMRFGFCHLGRFAIDYRKAFQELPSETLRS